MISVQTRPRLWNAERWAALVHDPVQAAWWSAFGLFHSLSLAILARRLLGSFDQPMLARQIICVSALATSLSVLLRNTRRHAGLARLDRATKIVLAGSLTIQDLLLLLSLSLPGTPVWGLVASWALLVGVEASWWTRYLDGRTINPVREPLAANSTAVQLADESPAPFESEETAEEAWPADVSQQFTRLRNEHGGETIVGGVRVDFAPRERHRVVHLAICPPLDAPPNFEIEQSEGSEVRIDVGQCEPFGVRLEVRLVQESDQVETAVLQFEMTSTG